MYITDDTFYSSVRDTTNVDLYFMRPCFTDFSLHSQSACFEFGSAFTVNSGVGTLKSGQFEYETPIMTTSGADAITFELSGTVDFPSDEWADFLDFKRKLYLMVVFSAGENGLLLTPGDTGKVSLQQLSINNSGVFLQDITIPGGCTVESINVGEVLAADESDVSGITETAKNDIILSAIPSAEASIELVDEDEKYAEFVNRSKKKLRALLYYRYNSTYSGTRIYYYSEPPATDHTQNPIKTTVGLVGLLGAMGDTYHNRSDGNMEPGETAWWKWIGADAEGNPPYLKMIVDAYNTGGALDVGAYADSRESAYGGRFVKLYSYNNTNPVRQLQTESIVSLNKEHYTCTPSDGYTYADALRLLINAQCHGMRVGNETIIADRPENLIKDSGAAIMSEDQYAVPTKTEYGEIDVVKFPLTHWVVGDLETLPGIDLDLSSDGELIELSAGHWYRKKTFVFDKSYASTSFTIDLYTENNYHIDYFEVIHKGSILTLIWPNTFSGRAVLTCTASPFKQIDDGEFSVKFGGGTETLELSNPFMRARHAIATYDIPDEYARYNYDQQANKTIYAIDARGRFDVAPLDRVLYQPPDGTQHTGIVIEHTLKYNGAMRSSFRVLDEGRVEGLVCSDTRFCSYILICI